MEIIVADHSGFCPGARYVVEIAESNGRAYSLGPILHNEQLIERLRKKGVIPLTLDEILEKRSGKVIIRAHGVPAEEITALKEAGFDVKDGTCSKVKDVYDISQEHESQGYKIFVFGDRDHPEVIGIVSRLQDPVVIGKVEDIPDEHYEKVCLVSQTTQIPSAYEEIRKALERKYDELKAIANTICPATQERQDAASALAKDVDVMLVIGGKKSSNTNNLYKLCRRVNPQTYHVQTKDDLDKEQFKDVGSVGITAGASTPNFIIISVFKELMKY